MIYLNQIIIVMNAILNMNPYYYLLFQSKNLKNKEQVKKEHLQIYSSILTSGMSLLSSFTTSNYKFKIQESDAGQKKLDELHRLKIKKLLETQLIKRKQDLELKVKFHKLGRNDNCLCGSGKKYKKCCYTKINKI